MFNFDRQIFLLNAINDFSFEKNYDKAILNLLGKLCCEYKFDKVSTFFNNRLNDEFRLLYSCFPDEDYYDFSYIYNEDKSIDIKDYNIFMLEQNHAREKLVGEFFAKSNIVHTKDFKSISKDLEILNFHYSNKDVKEFFLYAVIEGDEIIGYYTFERYQEEYTSEQDTQELTTFLNLINLRVKETERTKELHKKHQIEKVISQTTEFERQLMIVEKDTFKLLYHNDSVGDFHGKSLINEKCFTIMHDRDKPCDNCPILNNELDKSIYTVTDFGVYGEYGEYIIRVSEINWKSEDDAYVVSIIDATQFVKDKMNTDVLTGGLTWFGFKDKIKNETTKNSRDTKYAYISMDVDGIKLVNSSHSRTVGNELLKQIFLIIEEFIEDGEYYCRVVADTYAIILKYFNDEILNERVNKLESVLSEMFRSVFSEISIVVTGGIYIVENNLFESLDMAFENTRIARSTVKGKYKNTFALYNDDLKLELQKNRYIEDKVVSALENNEFLVYLQPKFELSTNKVIGAEALVRWKSSEEMFFPDKFIPVFEKNGFVLTLDFIVYEKVFSFIRECLDENIDIMPISINASRNHLNGDDFLKKLLKLLNSFNIPRDLIEIEITENASEDDKDNKLHDFVDKLKKEKIAVSIDDFGAAYSSLNLLKTLCVDTLKLDKEFLNRMHKDKKEVNLARDKIIIKNIVNMAKELEFKVICEGIETEEQREFLKSVGCDYGQGYLFEKPIPIVDFKNKFLKNQSFKVD